MKTTSLPRKLLACTIIAGFQIALNLSVFGQTASSQVKIIQSYGQISSRFERNEGQADSRVRYLTRGGGYTMYFAPSEITIDVSLSTNSLHKEPVIEAKIPPYAPKAETGTVHFLLESAEPNAELSAEGALPTKVNYFIGNNPTQWHTNISTFGQVRYRGLYQGIDAVFYGNQTHLEYDFRIAPHADPNRIGLKIEGATHIRTDANGNLVIGVGRNEVQLAKPVAYQMVNGIRQEVTATFHLDRDKLGFGLGTYDPENALVIDPVLSYSTFLGGECVASAVAVDSAGAAYVTGWASAPFSTLSSNAFQTNWNTKGGPAFVAKINPTGTALAYETYLGGGNNDNYGYGIAVDSVGNAYVGGFTYSAQFPTTASAFEPNWKSKNVSGDNSGFITKLNTNGSALVWSSFITGKNSDAVVGVDVDSSNYCYVTGNTGGAGFPITNAFMSTFPGLVAAFVTKIAPNGNSLIYSTYYGGNDEEQGNAIKVRPDGSVLVCGVTASLNFPVTNAVQPNPGDSKNGTWDSFLFSLSANGKTNLFSTYFGGETNDWAYGVGFDTNGYIYLAGKTWSTNFPTTNALQSQLNGGSNRTNSDGYVAKFTPDGRQLIFSTFLGGTYNDDTKGAVVQPNGDTIIVGQTGSIDFAPYDNYGSINHGRFDGFVCKLNSTGTVLMNFAYLGGTNDDDTWQAAVDGNQNVYVVGSTTSPDFPISSTNVADPTYVGTSNFNGYIAKLYFEPNQLGTEVTYSWTGATNWGVLPGATLALSNNWAGASLLPSVSSNGVTSLVNTRFQRGASYDPTYTSFIIPLTQQTGIRLNDLGDDSSQFGGSHPWFTLLQNDIRTHISLMSSTNGSGLTTNYYGYVTNFNNPIAAFGATAGCTPLYLNTEAQFGVYCGAQYESTNNDGAIFQSPLRILVYRLSDFVAGQTNLVSPIATNTITIPRRTVAGDQTAWDQFASNGFTVTIQTNGLRTTVQLVDQSSGAWGVVPGFSNALSGTYVVTHGAVSNAGYGYVLEGVGGVPLNTNLYPMVTNSAGAVGWDRLYAMDFAVRPPWQSVLISEPQFNGTPMPSFYQGASLSELTNSDAVLSNTISLSGSTYTNLDYSPELRRHPALDNFVSQMNNDPIALANYVINQIQLSDALAYNENNGNASAPAVNEGGVNRGALGTFLESRGSPVEQCALLVYLLRQAGYPAAFVFPTNNNVQMQDTRLSQLLRMQLHGAVNQYGQTYTTNTLITVNYPWVVTTISNQCIQIFPWLKDTQVIEGLNLYDYMPTNYDNGFKWLRSYLYADTNILSLDLLNDSPSVLFPAFVKTQLLTNSPGISLDDIGVQSYDRQHYYSRWQDFPTPTMVNNQSQVVCVDSLTSSGITNVSLGLTNIFNTVTITVSSQDTTNTMTVGPLRMADLHNREMLVFTNGTNMQLWLAPYIASNTNQSAFDSSDPALTNTQVATLALSTNDTQFLVSMTHNRHQSITFSPTDQFLGVSEVLEFTTPNRPFELGDVVAICFNVGSVSPAMLDVWASAYQQYNYQWSLNTNNVPPVQNYQGLGAYLMGMDYYAKVSQFLPINEQLHKVQVVSWFAEGLAKLTPVQLGAQNFMRPSLDMFFSDMAQAGNGSSHPDSGNDYLAAGSDFNSVLTGEIAAQEHDLLNGFYLSSNSVSSVTLLRLAQERATSTNSGILQLNKNNYLAIGSTNAVGYGPTKLMNYDTNIWSAVSNAFQGAGADLVTAFITPGPVSVSEASYRGMGLLIIGNTQSASLISVNMNGALGQVSSFFGDTPAALSAIQTDNSPTGKSSVDSQADIVIQSPPGSGGDIYITDPSGSSSDFNWVTGSFDSSAFGLGEWNNTIRVQNYATAQGTAAFTSPSQVNFAQQINALNHYSASTPPITSLSTALSSGFTGLPNSKKNPQNYVAEPVNVMSGEFYHDSVDLTLAGPQPLQLRRNYSSQNPGDFNGFGYGWNLSIVPYIDIATNATTNVILTAVDLDGSVIAYRQTTNNSNLFVATVQDNPQLDNFGGGQIGSIYNPFNAQVVHSFAGTNELYTLSTADGQIRTYVVNAFPVYSPTNVVTRQRPYLATWQDTESNMWTCTYGTDTNANDYGSLKRIQCSNGNFLGFQYNAAGFITEAYTGDGQDTTYEYDDFGDLVHVVLPDASDEMYEYQHTQFTNNDTIYVDSSHLIVKQVKPDGRVLENIYDGQGRVINQLATVGADLNVYTNATFIYSNNFVSPMTNSISGYTLVKDVNGNTNRYDYTNGLLTLITDPLNQTIQQNWYATNATAPGYPRSAYQIKDKRGRWTQFQYDAFGNVTNSFTWGDLIGDGSTQYATNQVAYNTNNLPLQITDPAGNSVQIVYDSVYSHLPQYIIRLAGGTPVITNYFSYSAATNVLVNGNLTLTNIALGLLRQSVRAFNSPDASTNQWSFDGRGFLTQHVQYTGTGDPNVTNSFYCDNRGEIVEMVDGAGHRRDFAYDDMGRPTSFEVFDINQTEPSFWQNIYYNGNGQVTWTEGPQFNPEGYVWHDYDGAGRMITEIHWRAEAMTNGAGVQAASGNNLYAQTFAQYDKFGNQTCTVDPRGAITTNLWDALGRLTQRKYYDLDGATILSTEGFGYEPGGLVHYYTNALGATGQVNYTINGQPEFMQLADGSTNAWRYYIDGRVQKEIQGNGAYWLTTYDDVNRITTRVFNSAVGSPLATNIFAFDRRGNLIQQTDARGNTFTNFFDGLDRLKAAVGPAIQSVFENCGMMPGCGTFATNTFQPGISNFFDAAGLVLTNVDALSETAITFFDVLGRPTRREIRDASNTLVRETSASYSADFHSVTVTNGSAPTAIVTTSYMDNDGRNVLSTIYPSANVQEYVRNVFDLSGNLIYQSHASATNGSSTEWSFGSYSYDGLNRLTNSVDRDNAVTTFAFDALSDLTNRVMPGGLKWQASYNSAGQMLQEEDIASGGLATRTNTYAYFSSGNPFAGLLQSRTDGRGVTCTYDYDDWLRVATNTHTGSLNEQNLSTVWQYEPRGFLTNVSQSFTVSGTGPSTSVQRAFDVYGQLSSEAVAIGGSTVSTAGQSWDAAGRRTILSLGNGYSFGWRADGALLSASFANAGAGTYTYDTAGMLTARSVGPRATTIDSRDGAGRPLSIATTVNLQTNLAETLTWTSDGLPSTETLIRSDFTDSRQFSYASLSRRLTQETLNLNAATRWTNFYTFDNGVSAGPGVLTSIGQTTSSSQWSGTPDAFSRIGTETNTVARQLAFGRVNGPATVTASLDGASQPVTVIGTSDPNWTNQWRATMEMGPGAHQLTLNALHQNGIFMTNASVWFTNNIANQTVADSIDAAGNLTQRIWKKPGGTTNLVQTLSWDGQGRLHEVSERDSTQSGRDLTMTYDAFGRRLQTTEITVTNNVSLTNQPMVVTHYFDPMVEFLELGETENGETTWKLIGPDSDGVYGGQNGTGGFEAEATALSLSPTIDDAFGNVLGEYSQATLTWNSSRTVGYGGVPGYRPLALGTVGSLASKYAWRNRAPETVGLTWMGGNWMDSTSGRFISADPYGHDGSPSLYSFCDGLPYAMWDADGRIGKGAGQWTVDTASGITRLLSDLYYSVGYVGVYPFSPSTAERWYGYSARDLAKTVRGAAQTTYDVSAMASYGLVSPFAPDQAYRAYGGSMERLGQLAPSLYGGSGKPTAYQVTYGTLNATTVLFGGEAGQISRVGTATDLSSQLANFAARQANELDRLGQAARNLGIGTTEFRAWAGNAPLNPRVAALQQALLSEGKVSFARGDLTLAEIGNIASGLQREVAITRVGQTRFLQLSGPYGGNIYLGAGEKLIGHIHPGESYWGLGPSAFGTDIESMAANGIFNQAVLNESGSFRIIRANGSMSTIFNIPTEP